MLCTALVAAAGVIVVLAAVAGTRPVHLAAVLVVLAAVAALWARDAARARRAQEQHDDLVAFARRAAHDLQGPLSVIEGWSVELALHLGASQPQAAMIIERIQGATEEAQALVGGLLADAVARDRPAVTQRVDLTAVARELADAHADDAKVVVLEVGVVAGDPVLLRQLLTNLLDNAVKYVPRGATPEVTVSGTRRGGELLVAVADRGIGVPAGAHQRIFDEFERAATGYPGTGLGLSICRRIAERHGGRISAHDRQDGHSGAVFELALPAWDPTITKGTTDDD